MTSASALRSPGLACAFSGDVAVEMEHTPPCFCAPPPMQEKTGRFGNGPSLLPTPVAPFRALNHRLRGFKQTSLQRASNPATCRKSHAGFFSTARALF